MAVKVSLEELVKAGAHFGHQSRRWNPKIEPYLYGEKDGVHVFDLTKTKVLLEEALEVLKNASKEGKIILLLGTKKQAREKVEKVAKEAGVFYVNERWLGGTLTNFIQIKRSIQKMSDMKAKKEKGEYSEFTKKERLLLDREIERLERFFGGIADMEKEPDLLVIIDAKKEISAIRESKAKDVPVIAVVDSNSDPTSVDYPIPMNDDATKAVDYVLELFKEAIIEGKGRKTQDEKRDKKKK